MFKATNKNNFRNCLFRMACNRNSKNWKYFAKVMVILKKKNNVLPVKGYFISTMFLTFSITSH